MYKLIKDLYFENIVGGKGIPPLIDGDVENVFRVFSERMIKKFNKTMNPRYNIYINRINGRLDPKSMILKDENVCFYMFGNM